jgi:hypothetical protein
MKTKEKAIKGFKGFDKDLKCRDFQYKEGEIYETDKKPVRCTENGFHLCLEPIDIFNYYNPAESKFHEVEGFGDSNASDEDSKIAVSKIKIGAEISLFDLVKVGVDMILKRCKKDTNKLIKDRSAAVNSGYSSAAVNSGNRSAAVNSGYRSAAVNSGDSSAAVNSGNSSAAVNSGNSSVAEVSGKYSIACGLGYENKAKASLNSWIVLTEWINDGNYHINNVKSAKIDGKKLKADTFYRLENGKFIKCEQSYENKR